MRNKPSVLRFLVVASLFSVIAYYSDRVGTPPVSERLGTADGDNTTDTVQHSNTATPALPGESARDVFFHAKVVAIRPASRFDKLIGKSRVPHSQVAVLRVSWIERGRDSRLAVGRVVALPIHDGDKFWPFFLSRNTDTRFNIFRVGKRELIGPFFGC